MTKRPRFSPNMHHPAKAQPEVTNVSGEGVEERVDPIAPQLFEPLDMRNEKPARLPEFGKMESLIDICEEAVTAMSLTSYQSWHQGLALQLRLSTYMLDASRRHFAVR